VVNFNSSSIIKTSSYDIPSEADTLITLLSSSNAYFSIANRIVIFL